MHSKPHDHAILAAEQEAAQDILQISGFKQSCLPFKYFGVPITSKKLTANEGRKLIDKVTARITSWGAKHLTYAGRLTLVTSVLSTLHNYWASIFLIPNGIMNRIDSICRNYLWGGKDSYLRAPSVCWDNCCCPKAEGGLGIKHAKTWNKALLGKYVWWVASKKDHLWVSHVYLKGESWINYTPPLDCSWSWKKIAHTMALFRPAYSVDGKWLGADDAYRVRDGYLWLRNPSPSVDWWKVCWNSLNVPKASFIFWAYKLGRLLTRDRLARMGGGTVMTCYFCNTTDETHNHLFFECLFSTQCIRLLQEKLHVQFDPRELHQWNKRGRRASILRRRFICACHVLLVYHIWQARNEARVMSKVSWPQVLVKQLLQATLTRFWARNVSVIAPGDQKWLQLIKENL